MRLKLCAFSLLLSCILSASSNDTINLQLKWWHQFQFAGYYAAQMKGFYAEEGLIVNIRQAHATLSPVKQVLDGKADYGITGSDLLLNFIKGDEVIALGAVFQHSPYIILSDSKSNIHSPGDLIGKTIMASNDQGWVELKAMLLKEGIPQDSVKIIDHSWNLDDLSNGKTDAQSAYCSVEPHLLRARGIEPSVLAAMNYGIDFYGDILFTTKEKSENNEVEVEKFRKASFRGWQYAMKHPDELANYILSLPGVKERDVTKEMLLQEYSSMNKLILPNVVEVGHMNPGRWQHILDVYQSLNLAPAAASIDGFVYDPLQTQQDRLSKLITSVCVLIGILLLVFVVSLYVQRRTKLATQMKLKKSEEHLELAVHSGGIGIWDWDITNDTVFYNDIWKSMLGYAPSEIEHTSNSFFRLIHPEDKIAFRKKVEEHIAGGSESIREVFRLRTKQGSWKWVLSQGKAQARNSKGIATQLAGIHLDMDELKKKEQELHRITNELMRMNTELQQFAFVTSHNLRAPAVNIKSLLDIMQREQLSGMNKSIHEKLDFSANMLLNTLKDLNDILTAKKETEKPRELIHIAERFDSLLSMYSTEMKLTGARVSTDLAVKNLLFPPTIFDSIIINLVSNSFKYRRKTIKPELRLATWEDAQYVFMKFSDNGKGIDLELQGEKMFKLYQRFHERTQGKGMGLYIIKTQVENLGGKITVASAPGAGAEFTVWFRKEMLN